MGTILKGLREIPWNSLEDSCGSAAEIPNLLSKIAWSQRGDALEALDELQFRICRDGIAVSQATPAAIPFIWNLIENSDVDIQAQLIHLLCAIFQTRQWTAAAGAAGKRYSERYSPQIEWERQSRNAVTQGVGILERIIGRGPGPAREAAGSLIALIRSNA